MTASLPPNAQVAQAPNAIEIFWERYKRIFQATFWLLLLGVFAYYGIRYYEQTQHNKRWAEWAEVTKLRAAYAPVVGETDPVMTAGYNATLDMLDEVRDASDAHFVTALAKADPAQKPFLLWLKACREARNGDVEAATKTAEELKASYPNHTLCVSTPYPVQLRKPVEKKKDKNKADEKTDEEPELKPAVAGSSVDLLLQNLKNAKGFVQPPIIGKPAIPADAPRYKVTLSGEYGSFVIALMTTSAPKICAKFEEIAVAKFWDGIKVDELVRPGAKQSRRMEATRKFHFGFESTRGEEDRTKWDTSAASKDEHTVVEFSDLSHFPGAVSARIRDGKTEVDRLYICESDSPSQDDDFAVFAYVVEGLESVRKVCDAGFSQATESDIGRGRPEESIVIQSVTKL